MRCNDYDQLSTHDLLDGRKRYTDWTHQSIIHAQRLERKTAHTRTRRSIHNIQHLEGEPILPRQSLDRDLEGPILDTNKMSLVRHRTQAQARCHLSGIAHKHNQDVTCLASYTSTSKMSLVRHHMKFLQRAYILSCQSLEVPLTRPSWK